MYAKVSLPSRNDAFWLKVQHIKLNYPVKIQDKEKIMAKEEFNRTKPHMNVGTIGHVDQIGRAHV